MSLEPDEYVSDVTCFDKPRRVVVKIGSREDEKKNRLTLSFGE